MNEQESKIPRRRFLKRTLYLGGGLTAATVLTAIGIKLGQDASQDSEKKFPSELTKEFDIVFNEVRKQKKGAFQQDYSNESEEAYRFSLEQRIYFLTKNKDGSRRFMSVSNPNDKYSQLSEYYISQNKVTEKIYRTSEEGADPHNPLTPYETTQRELNGREISTVYKLLKNITEKLE